MSQNGPERPGPSGSPAIRRPLVHRLNGAMLISVTFIHDFLELTFERAAEDGRLIDTPRLDCLVWPEVVTSEGGMRLGAVGYRDALCRCIGVAVTEVRDDATSGMQLLFPDTALVFKPTPDELSGPEIALLHFFDTKELAVWRPGEDTFADLG